MNNCAIKVNNVTKVYKLYNRPIDRLVESLNLTKKKRHSEFYALKNITFQIKKGETVGFIGRNGAGKSTLLKIIAGIITPSFGEVEVNGKISALLELGAGFNPEYTGMENIYLYGTIMGLSKEEIAEKQETIIDFADIGDFIYQPVKTYSSGMFVRLAFACAVNVEPEILIIDEALSVGDMRFQQKCYRKINDFKENGTVLFVSHDLGAIVNFCDRVIWFKDGEIYRDGLPEEVVDEYHAFMTYETTFKDNEYNEGDYQGSSFSNQSQVFGEMGATITFATLLNHEGKENAYISGGEKVGLIIKVVSNKDIGMPILGFILKDRLGNPILIVNNETENLKIKPLIKGQHVTYKFSFNFPMVRDGIYSVDLAIAEGTYENHIQHHWINDALIVEVKNKKPYSYAQGLCILDKVELMSSNL